jgi:hypothetical protein
VAIEKGKIELQPGAIAPIERGLWHAAWEKLQEAAAGVKQMEDAKDRIQYEGGWTRLVDSLEEFWTRFFDEGKNTFSAFQPWAGAIDAKRKGDPLLAYLYQSRHQSQHGRIALEWESGTISVGGGEFFGTVRDLKIFTDGTFQADVNATPGSDARFKTLHDPGKARLPSIVNKKHNQAFQPPSAHLDRSITDLSPINVGRLGIAFYEDVLRQGFVKFGKAP